MLRASVMVEVRSFRSPRFFGNLLAAVVLCSGKEARRRNLAPVAVIRSFADAATVLVFVCPL